MSRHLVLKYGNVAVVTGGASGIGLAAARRFAAAGMKVCIADRKRSRLDASVAELTAAATAGPGTVMGVQADVSKVDEIRHLAARVRERFGPVSVLMNNAGTQPGSEIFGPAENWQQVISVNLWGVIYGTQTFVPEMIATGQPGLVINTGSKQGITTPPGDPAYNVSKAGVKVFTEALEHQLRNTPGCAITAHLLIPGFVFTPLTANGRTEKPPAAWTPEQTIDFMFDRLALGDFYILCPDNDVSRQIDEHRIAWAAGDIIANRPPLSRWHKDFAEKFKASLPESAGLS
jgi:NAD(P)-dependent dehydrogenase (short-subunit alcohol dehydrogenase family)